MQLTECNMSKVMKGKAKKTTNTKDTAKVFDVTRPGKTTVSATSRPVIVGHKPQVKDPMMAKHNDEDQALLDSTQKVTVQPSSEAAKPAEQDEHSSPTSAPPVPDSSDTVTEPESDTASPDQTEDKTDAPTFASVAVTSAVEKPVLEPSAPELEPNLAADILDNDTPTDTVQPKETPEASDQTQPSPESAEPEVVSSSAPTVPDQAPETNNSTVGVVFEEPTSARKPMETPEGTDPLPVLPDEPIPQTIIVAHHTPKAGAGKVLLVIILVLIFAAIIFDVLLDAGFIVLDGIPHTDFF